MSIRDWAWGIGHGALGMGHWVLGSREKIFTPSELRSLLPVGYYVACFRVAESRITNYELRITNYELRITQQWQNEGDKIVNQRSGEDITIGAV
jgi:hypothetical protein